MNKIHIRYDLYAAPERHAQEVMRELGVTYVHATPQSMGDQWWFWCCENLPDPLPPYMSRLELDPQNCVGWGLNQENADKITEAMNAR